MRWRAVGWLGGAMALLSCRPEGLQRASVASTMEKVVFGTSIRSNVMFLLDRSGSMNQAIDPSIPACTDSEGRLCGEFPQPLCDSSRCPTRMSELKGAMRQFLAAHSASARFGLTVFPSPSQGGCAPATLVQGQGLEVAIPEAADDRASDLGAASVAITTAIDHLAPGGGTPTGASLRALASYAPLMRDDGRSDFVVVITDGLPNCNSENPANGDVPGSGCSCTLSSCRSVPPTVNPLRQTGCLDAAGTLEQVRTLRAKDVRVLVVGFGADVKSPEAFSTLNQMAEAGAFQRSCSVDADCGSGDACDGAGLCGRRFFPASNGTELSRALELIAAAVHSDACLLTLREAPEGESAIRLTVDDQTIAAGDDSWHYEAVAGAASVRLLGNLCQKAMDASELVPLHIKVDLLIQ